MLRIFFAGLLVFLMQGLNAQVHSKIHPLLTFNAENNLSADCIILFKEQPDLSQAKLLSDKREMGRFVFDKLKKNAEKEQQNTVTILKNAELLFEPFFVVNAIRTVAPLDILAKIAALAEVAEILPNIALRSDFPIEQNTDYRLKLTDTVEWGIKMIAADKLWKYNIKGKGVTVGGQDTGYDWDHPAIINQYRGYNNGLNTDHNYNWHDAIHDKHPMNADSLNPCGFNSVVPCDDHSHGTHTVGTMIGFDGTDNRIGVAPEANWIGCRNMERGWGQPSTYIECFEWFLAPTDLNNGYPNPDLAPHVINNSWSCPSAEGCNPSNFEAMRIAVHNLRLAGIVVVVSAGNSGPSCSSISAPASIFKEVFAVGASNGADSLANFSSRGPVTVIDSAAMKPNVSAPGVMVRSSVIGTGYIASSGTSMAGPHVAGAVALLISAAPELAGKVDMIENILEQSATPIYATNNCAGLSADVFPNYVTGYGRIDLWKALEIVRPDLVNGIEDKKRNLLVFPNPSPGHIYLVAPEDMGDSQLRVYNALGQEVHQRKLNFQRLINFDLSELPDGMYYLSIISENHPKKKFTVQWKKIN